MVINMSPISVPPRTRKVREGLSRQKITSKSAKGKGDDEDELKLCVQCGAVQCSAVRAKRLVRYSGENKEL